jgi:hypothetical protein
MANPTTSSRSRILRRRFVAPLTLAMAPLAFGCSSVEPTEIVAGVVTQLQVPKYLKSLGVTVKSGGSLVFCAAYPVADGTVTLPSTFGSVEESDADTPADGDPLTMQMFGFRDEAVNFDTDCVAPNAASQDDLYVVRRRRTTYVQDKILYMPMPLKESCALVDHTCDPDSETCVGGKCVPMDLDSATLPLYNDRLVFGNTNTCFSADICMPSGQAAPVTLDDKDSCSFTVQWPDGAPQPRPGNLNVRVTYDTFGTEILDLDAQEGFEFLDPNDPLKFKLADNMCDAVYQKGRILSMTAAALCPAKSPFQPICAGDIAEILSSSELQSASQQTLCTGGPELKAAESRLYLLMDRSQSMGSLFGDPALQFAVATPLENPVSEFTEMAFQFLPLQDPATACGTTPNPYADPMGAPTTGFEPVALKRSAIGAALGDAGNVLAGDPDLNLDLAMEGAYAALLAEMPSGMFRFNGRALVIIGNRDFVARCNGPTTETLATNAFNTDGIRTYAVVLEGGPATAETDAAALVTDSGGRLYNGANDVTEGAKAVQEIFNDLGSCLYEPPDSSVVDILAPDETVLSYQDPITQQRLDIPKNNNCQEATAATESGWNRDSDGMVRVCGSYCDDLRSTLNDVALANAALGAKAPKIPLHVQTPCQIAADAAKAAANAGGNEVQAQERADEELRTARELVFRCGVRLREPSRAAGEQHVALTGGGRFVAAGFEPHRAAHGERRGASEQNLGGELHRQQRRQIAHAVG